MLSKIKEYFKNFVQEAGSFKKAMLCLAVYSTLLLYLVGGIADTFWISMWFAALLSLISYSFWSIFQDMHTINQENKVDNKELQEALDDYISDSTDNIAHTDRLAVQLTDERLLELIDYELYNEPSYFSYYLDFEYVTDLLMEAEYRGLGIDLEGFEE